MGVAAQTLPPVQRHQFKTADPERAHAFIWQNYGDYTVRFSGSPKEFTFAHTMTSAPGFSIARVRHSMAVKADANPLGKLLIIQLFSGYLENDLGQETIRFTRTQPLLVPPSRSFQVAWDNFDAGTVTLDLAVVADYAEGAGGIHPAGLEFTRTTPVSPLMARHWQSVVHHVVRDVLPNAEAMASALIRGQTHRLLAASLLATFPNTALDALTDSPAGVVEPRAVRRAVAFIDAHAGEDIGIAEIAEAARIGPRALQRAFRQYRDTTPMEYLRRVRLDHAHRELLVADPSRGDTVSAIAARWGFAHAGRFSMAYHAVYGCFPSQTLHR
ncbi:MAG: helix-turn-helix transcriptional regulator [Pseudonocardiaceae bacterium]